MAYLIFDKHKENEVGSLISIAENENDRDNLNTFLETVKVITIDEETFQDIKLSNKIVMSYSGDNVTYKDINILGDQGNWMNGFFNKERLKGYIDKVTERINMFLKNNENHIDYSKWNSYKSQLEDLNLDNITYPLNKSLEQHFLDNSQTVLNPLQIP